MVAAQPVRLRLGPVKKTGRVKRYLLVTAGLLVVVGSWRDQGRADRVADGDGQADGEAGPPPEAVGSAVAQAADLGEDAVGGGQRLGVRSVTVSNEVPGIVSQIRFESGAIAKEGQVLVELDADVERAQLASAKARRDLAETDRASAPRCWPAGQRHLARAARRGRGAARDRDHRRTRGLRRRSTARSCARRSRAGSASAPSTSGST